MKKYSKLIIISIVVIALAVTCGIFVKKSIDEKNRNPFIGEWTDSYKTNGFNFKDDGTVEITYLNVTVPIIDVKYNGTLDGTYDYNKDTSELSVTFSILSKSITVDYKYEITDNNLTLTNTSSGKSSTYILNQPQETTVK